MIELHDDDLSNYGCVFELGGGKDGLMYPASGTSPALVLDASGNGNNGVNSGAVLVADHLGNSDGALQFATTNKIAITHQSWQLFRSAFSFVIAYTQSGGDSGLPRLFEKTTGIIIRDTGSSIGVTIGTGSEIVVAHGLSGASTLRFIVVTVDANSLIKIYANGVYKGQGTSGLLTTITGTGNLNIGNRDDNTRALYGKVFEGIIYGTELTNEQQSALYSDLVAGRTPSITTNLLAYYPMNRLNYRTNSGIDTAGNNTVTNNGATPCPDHNGRANRGMLYVATKNAHKVIPNNLIVRNQSKLTIDVSFKKTAAPDIVYLISNYVSTSDLFNVVVDATGIQLTLGTTSIYARFNFTQDTNWHYAQFVFDGSGSTDADKVKLVLNGVSRLLTFAGTIPTATPNTNGSLYFMRQSTTYSNGSRDWTKIYNGVTNSISECLKNYNFWSSH